MKADLWAFFENMSRKFKFRFDLTTKKCILPHEEGVWGCGGTKLHILNLARNGSER